MRKTNLILVLFFTIFISLNTVFAQESIINDNSLSIESVVVEGNHETAFPMTGVRSVTWLSGLIKE